MKRTKLYNNVTSWAVALSLLVGFASCSNDQDIDSDKEWVDPRYRNLEESYTVAADGSDVISFEVKSNMEWSVYNANEGWCTISPSSGDDPDTTYEVVVTYAPNSGLDDRFDTLSLKSDYWVFKEVAITQLGVAMLTIDKESDFIGQYEDEAKGSLKITTNQDWRVEIASDCDWLTFDSTSATSGTGDGSSISDFTVSYSAEQNDGEQRSTTISILDRNDEVQYTYAVTQEGLLLTTDDEFYFFVYDGGDVTIPVNSNVDWSVELVQSTVWIENLASSITTDETEEPLNQITFSLTANNGASRAAYLRLTSQMNVAGVDPVIRYVGVVQGSSPTPEYTYFNDVSIFDNIGVDGWYVYNGAQPDTVAGDEGVGYIYFSEWGRLMSYPSGIPYGRYDLTLSDIGASTSSDTFFFYLQFDNVSSNYVGMNINGGSYSAKIQKGGSDTDFSPTVYTPANLGALIDNDSHAITDMHKLGIDIYLNDETGYLGYDWYINDVLIQSVTEDTAWTNDAYATIHSLCFGVNPSATGYVYSYSYTAPSEYDARPELPEE